MSEVRFYHLQKSTIDHALPRILEKAVSVGKRIIVKVPDVKQSVHLSEILWTYSPNSFLPHDMSGGENDSKQPILIALENQNQNANNADMIVLLYGATHDDISEFALCCEMFEHQDDTSRAAAREKWKIYKDQGHDVTYWQQTDKGGWEQKN